MNSLPLILSSLVVLLLRKESRRLRLCLIPEIISFFGPSQRPSSQLSPKSITKLRGSKISPSNRTISTDVVKDEAVVADTTRRPKARPLQQRRPNPSKLGSAARLPHFADAWHEVTSNSFILNIVKYGYKLQFITPPIQSSYSPRVMSASASAVTMVKVRDLLREGALVVVLPSSGQFISHIFPVAKRSPGEFRIIFDLSILNKFIRKLSFRMDRYITIIGQIFRGDFFISIDLTDAYPAMLYTMTS